MNKSIGGENMAQIGSFLGLDFGKSKIGLAVADEETKVAFALDTIKNDKDFLRNLQEIIKRENVKKIIIGMTLHEKDVESKKEKESFGKMLEEKFGVEVEYQEEMFTTKMAHENIKMRGGRNIAKLDDQEAARIILQSWLDKKYGA